MKNKKAAFHKEAGYIVPTTRFIATLLVPSGSHTVNHRDLLQCSCTLALISR